MINRQSRGLPEPGRRNSDDHHDACAGSGGVGPPRRNRQSVARHGSEVLTRLTPTLRLRLTITLGNILRGRFITWIPATHYIHSSKPDPKGYKMNFFINRDHKKTSLMAALLFLGSGLCTLGGHQAAAAEPQLEKAIQDGEALFVHETFGGAGNTCQTCHVEGGAGPGKSSKGDASQVLPTPRRSIRGSARRRTRWKRWKIRLGTASQERFEGNRQPMAASK